MLENVDLTRQVDTAQFKQESVNLQMRLFLLSRTIRRANIPILVLIEGWDAVGKGMVTKHLMDKQDPRGFTVTFFMEPRTQERQFPWLRRYWLNFPSYGQIGIFCTGWYRRVLTEYIEERVSRKERDQALADIVDLERSLSDDGMCIVKFLLHISEEEQKKRLKKMEKLHSSRYRVTEAEWVRHKAYSTLVKAGEVMLQKTESEWAPWYIIGATHKRYTKLKVMKTLVTRLEEALCERGIPLPENYPTPEQAGGA